MIGKLTGKIILRKPNLFILNVNGVGYNVHVPLSTYFKVSDDGAPVTLEIFTHVKEDAISLFGFLTEQEKALFERLIAISGIGPKMAINMMSGIDLRELVRAISCSDVDRLRSVPGIGRKTAERVILELKDKLRDLAGVGSKEEEAVRPGMLDAATKETLDDVLSALVNLGFKSVAAKKSVEDSFLALRKQDPQEVPVFEDLFRRSLKLLMKR